MRRRDFLRCLPLPLAGLASSCSNRVPRQVAFVPPGISSLFWESCRAGALAAADTFTVALRSEFPDIVDRAASQRDILENLIAARPHAILICPADPVDLAPLLQQASESGIAIGLLEIACEAPYAVCVRSDAGEEGRLAARHLVAKIPEGGSAAVVVAAGAQNNRSKDAFIAELEAMPKPVGTAVQSLDFADEIAALNHADALLRPVANIQGVFCPEQRTSVALTRAARRIGKTPPIVGYSGDFALRQALSDGAIDALVVPDAFQVGYAALRAIADSSQEMPAGLEIEILPRLITRDRLDSHETRAFLDPTFQRSN